MPLDEDWFGEDAEITDWCSIISGYHRICVLLRLISKVTAMSCFYVILMYYMKYYNLQRRQGIGSYVRLICNVQAMLYTCTTFDTKTVLIY